MHTSAFGVFYFPNHPASKRETRALTSSSFQHISYMKVKIPGLSSHQNKQIEALPIPQQQIFIFRLRQHLINEAVTQDWFHNHYDFVTQPDSFGTSCPSFDHYLLHVKNSSIRKLWKTIFGHEPCHNANDLYHAELMIQTLTNHLLDQQKESSELESENQTSHEEWLVGLRHERPEVCRSKESQNRELKQHELNIPITYKQYSETDLV